MSNTHPNRGRSAHRRRLLLDDLRNCAEGRQDRIQLWPHECALLMEELDRIPQLEIHARKTESTT